MQVILQGSLGHFAPDQLLTFFSSFHHSGTLAVVCEQGRARVFFDEGDVVHAEATSAGSVEEILCNLFVWADGTFAFTKEAVLPDGVQRVSVDLTAVIAEGRRRADERKYLTQLYPTDDIRLAVVDDVQMDQINLTSEEFKILMKVGRGHTLRQLRTELKRSAADLYPIVHRLETAGLLARNAPLSADEIKTAVNVDIDIPSPAATTRVSAITAAPAPPPQQAAPPPPARPAPQPAPPPPAPEPIVRPPEPPQPRKATVTRAQSGPMLMASLTAPNGAPILLVDSVYSIGRDAKNEIPINDGSVSTQHARIMRTDGGFSIEDNQSRNGTFVNGEKIAAPRLLADTDVIRFGKVVFTFNIAKATGAPQKTDR
jgi:hypothetical protein